MVDYPHSCPLLLIKQKPYMINKDFVVFQDNSLFQSNLSILLIGLTSEIEQTFRPKSFSMLFQPCIFMKTQTREEKVTSKYDNLHLEFSLNRPTGPI